MVCFSSPIGDPRPLSGNYFKSATAATLLTLITGVAAIALARVSFIPYPCTYAGASLISLDFILAGIFLVRCLRRKREDVPVPPIPNEVLFIIFEMLDLKALIKASFVCKTWNDLAQDRRFLPHLKSISWYEPEPNLLRAFSSYRAFGNSTYSDKNFGLCFDFERFSGNRWLRIKVKPFGIEVELITALSSSPVLNLERFKISVESSEEKFFKKYGRIGTRTFGSIVDVTFDEDRLYLAYARRLLIYDLSTKSQINKIKIKRSKDLSLLINNDLIIVNHGNADFEAFDKKTGEERELAVPDLVKRKMQRLELSDSKTLFLSQPCRESFVYSHTHFFRGFDAYIIYPKKSPKRIFSFQGMAGISVCADTLVMETRAGEIFLYDLINNSFCSSFSKIEGTLFQGVFGGIAVFYHPEDGNLTLRDFRPYHENEPLQIEENCFSLDETFLSEIFKAEYD